MENLKRTKGSVGMNMRTAVVPNSTKRRGNKEHRGETISRTLRVRKQKVSRRRVSQTKRGAKSKPKSKNRAGDGRALQNRMNTRVLSRQKTGQLLR